MRPKPPSEEHALILARDHRRRYGVRVQFQIQSIAHIGDIETATLQLPTGAIATFAPMRMHSWEGGRRLKLTVEGFATAADAEHTGTLAAQALLLTAISCNFGLRLNYHTLQPGEVFDRLASEGASMWGEGVTGWNRELITQEIIDGISRPLLDQRLRLSMELFAAAYLEPNDRARFIMLVSALEPLADQQVLPDSVQRFVSRAVAELDRSSGIESDVQQSLRGRVLQLKSESVRQALFRLCGRWFPGDLAARASLDRAYALRSELLHEGAPGDTDIRFSDESVQVTDYLRRIYAMATNKTLRSPAAV
jgi:hypothetical protein